MELRRFMSVEFFLLLFLVPVFIVSSNDRIPGACCLPDQLSGQITISPRLRRSLNDRKDFQTPIEFSVDFSRGLMFGEHKVQYPRLRHVQFVADIRNEVHYIRERTSNRCWKFPIGRRMRKPCSLDQAKFRGSFSHNSDDSKRNGRKLIYDRRAQSENEYFISWLKFRSLLVVEEDTCLPVLDAHADDLDYYVAFHKMKHGLGRFREFWKDESDEWTLDDCSDSIEESQEETETGTDSHRDTRRQSSDDRTSDRKKWLRIFFGMEKYREKDDDRNENDNDVISRILQLDIYLYLLRHFFPRPPPEPCCGPKQWQASVTKTITYTYVQSNYVGQSTTSLPHLYVDHANGRMATDIIEYVNGVATSNISLLALFGQNNSDPVLSIYAVDWKKSPVTCTYLQVTDVHGPMRNNCMPASAQFERTIRLGSGPFNSIRLDAYNVSGTSKWGNGQLDYSAESYVVPHECMPIMEVYNWKTSNTKVSGSLLMSNTRTGITDPTSAFQVPTVCQTTAPVKLTSTQIEDSISYVLSYVG